MSNNQSVPNIPSIMQALAEDRTRIRILEALVGGVGGCCGLWAWYEGQPDHEGTIPDGYEDIAVDLRILDSSVGTPFIDNVDGKIQVTQPGVYMLVGDFFIQANLDFMTIYADAIAQYGYYAQTNVTLQGDPAWDWLNKRASFSLLWKVSQADIDFGPPAACIEVRWATQSTGGDTYEGGVNVWCAQF